MIFDVCPIDKIPFKEHDKQCRECGHPRELAGHSRPKSFYRQNPIERKSEEV